MVVGDCRQIEAEHEVETQELQQCWMQLRTVVQQVYRDSCSRFCADHPSEGTTEAQPLPLPDLDKAKELVSRLA